MNGIRFQRDDCRLKLDVDDDGMLSGELISGCCLSVGLNNTAHIFQKVKPHQQIILDGLVVMISACQSLISLTSAGDQGSIPCQGASILLFFLFLQFFLFFIFFYFFHFYLCFSWRCLLSLCKARHTDNDTHPDGQVACLPFLWMRCALIS